MATSREEVEFKTLDGLTLRGLLFPAKKHSPAIILAPGLNCPKELLLPDIAADFQRAGITALIYDSRCVGQSDGMPRNDTDPFKQTEDHMDALTYLRSLDSVDASSIGYWGMSSSGTTVACAAALDPRAKFSIIVCPRISFTPPKKLAGILVKCVRDRESQMRGNAPASVVLASAKGDSLADDLSVAGAAQASVWMANLVEKGWGHMNRSTMQSYYKNVVWQPRAILKMVQSPPLMMLTPEKDEIAPTADQLAFYEELTGPKRLHVAPGMGHLDILSSEEAPALMKMQVDFIRRVLAGTLDDEEDEEEYY
ncbi:alpha/beta-hydrolase [Mollisia scopiformis]|uniref:Alpha/beta-hydrolase n=1 Tax=Mollisia scopiformis TaxID=149040 RepID=A0A194XHG5_MOLSC|nr:alpha/beta-hydrolase [Mollisia scopiformis]KUJ19569.1 alpha/beta-hydrolase [Mollisia scopiformis]